MKFSRLVPMLSGLCFVLAASIGAPSASAGIRSVGVKKAMKDPRSSRTYKGVRNLAGPQIYRVPRTPIGMRSSYRVFGRAYRSPGRRPLPTTRPSYRAKLSKTKPLPKRATSVMARTPTKVTRVARKVTRRKPAASIGMRSAPGASSQATALAFEAAFRDQYGFAD